MKYKIKKIIKLIEIRNSHFCIYKINLFVLYLLCAFH